MLYLLWLKFFTNFLQNLFYKILQLQNYNILQKTTIILQKHFTKSVQNQFLLQIRSFLAATKATPPSPPTSTLPTTANTGVSEKVQSPTPTPITEGMIEIEMEKNVFDAHVGQG